MLRALKRTLSWLGLAVLATAFTYCGLLLWPKPLFAYSLGTGKIVVASDRPISALGGERFLRDFEGLLARSPLKPQNRQYQVHITNEDWRRRLFFLPSPDAWGVGYARFGGSVFLSGADFETGRVVHRGYIGTPPRTLAYLCAHELTHVIVAEHLGWARYRIPEWVDEGFADYVGIENRQGFAALRDALGDRPVDTPLRMKYGSYPRYRLLVTFFLERKGWTIDQLMRTNLSEHEAEELMRADTQQ